MTCVRGNEGRDRKKGEGGKAGMGDKDVCRTHIKGVVSNLAWLSLATYVFFRSSDSYDHGWFVWSR